MFFKRDYYARFEVRLKRKVWEERKQDQEQYRWWLMIKKFHRRWRRFTRKWSAPLLLRSHRLRETSLDSRALPSNLGVDISVSIRIYSIFMPIYCVYIIFTYWVYPRDTLYMYIYDLTIKGIRWNIFSPFSFVMISELLIWKT